MAIAPGVRGRSMIEEMAMIAVVRVGWVVWVHQGIVPVRLFGAVVRVIV